ncbi:MAG: hypothetical protein MUE60_08925 [Candidatus Eisenbacteria bacterium]|nr:hypothetical protein [Candidatus Eisenbacteria bacterium]
MTDAPLRGSNTRADYAAARPGQTPEPGDGVDVTLIRWMLSLSPAQRLEVLQNAVNSLAELRDATSRT